MVNKLQALKRAIDVIELEPAICWTAALAVFVSVRPLISLFHEIAVLAAANLLSFAATSSPLDLLIRTLIADQVYASVALEMIGNIHTHGIAVDAPVGGALHNLLPAFFVDPGLVAEGAWASAVIALGSSQISQLLAVTSADGLLILVGVLLVQWGLRGGRLLQVVVRPRKGSLLVLFGLLLQARGVFAILTAQIAPENLESAGLAQVGTKLMSATRQSYESDLLPFSPLLSVGIQVLMLAIAYAIALFCTRLILAVPRIKCRAAKIEPERCSTPPHLSKAVFLLPLVAVVIWIAVTPSFGAAATNFSYDNLPTSDSYAASDAQPSDEALATGDAGIETISSETKGSSPPKLPARPSVVSITGNSYDYVYEVDGKRDMIRGIGYNVIYRQLTVEERDRRYEQDFARMKDAGINTILGWDSDKGYEHDKFDELLLARAYQYDLGVMMPFYLPPDGDYGSEEFRADILAKVTAWVLRFKDHPAVRMWAIGNEVLHGMPATGDARAFAEFYLELADAVHEIDPNHPVIYRDAEDVFIGPLKAGWTENGAQRPWLVYGMNIFTYRVRRVLEEWPQQQFDVPLVITEFGPNGLSAEDRPRGLVKMWRMIRKHESNVFGGIIYAWTTAGPEPIDRVFGLVDELGQPVDGSLNAIADEFRWEAQQMKKDVFFSAVDQTRVQGDAVFPE